MKFFLTHKVASIVAMLLLVGGGMVMVARRMDGDDAIRYVVAEVRRGTLVVSTSGSGQVSVAQQADIKPKASGDLIAVAVREGQTVRAGALLARIDTRDAEKAVRDAEVNLASARLTLEKIRKPPDALAFLQAEHAVTEAREAKERAQDDRTDAYEDGFTAVANVFLDLPGILTGFDAMLFDATFGRTQDNVDWYLNQVPERAEERGAAIRGNEGVIAAFHRAKDVYGVNAAHYRTTSRASDRATIDALITETYATTEAMSDAVKAANNFIDLVQDVMEQRDLTIPTGVATHQAALDGYTGTANTHLAKLLAIRRTIEASGEAIVDADRTIAEKDEALAKLRRGADALDIQSQELAITQREHTLRDAQERLADYIVRAPFDGVIALWDAKRGDVVSPSTTLGTFIAPHPIAEISLNEVDVARIAIGQRVTLTFDAIVNLALTGRVTAVDAVGVVSQGVVTYTVDVAFDTEDAQVKPGMSVNAAVITDTVADALLVPSAAVKSSGGMDAVDVVESTDARAAIEAGASGAVLVQTPRRQEVAVGMSNDEFTVITSGLAEGDVVVTRTIQPTTAITAPASSSVRIPGLPSGGGGFRGGAGR